VPLAADVHPRLLRWHLPTRFPDCTTASGVKDYRFAAPFLTLTPRSSRMVTGSIPGDMPRLQAILRTLIVLPALAAMAMAQPGPAPTARDDVPLFPSRHNLFDIPFQIDEPIPGQEPVEVQLHVSENRGVTWHLASKAKPEDGRFSFRAAHDGEFWFLVRTLNRQGRLLPEKPFEPEMRVMIDTEPPTIEVQCTRGSAGEIVCAWKLLDPNLKPNTLQLTYQGIDSGPHWSTVGAVPSTQAADGSWTGKTSFVPSGVKSPVFVRIEATDAAGNRATAQAQVETPAGAGPMSLPSTSANRTPWTSAAPGTDGRPLNGVAATPNGTATPNAKSPNNSFRSASSPGDEPPPLADRFPGREMVPTPRSSEGSAAPYRPASEPKTTETKAVVEGEAIGPGGVEPLPLPPADTAAKRTLLPEPNRQAPEPPPANTTKLPKPAADAGPTFAVPENARPPEAVSTPVAPRTAPFGNTKMPEAGDAAPPTGVKPRMVNSRRFELEYDVESTGSAGVAKVELWTTRDAGTTWTLSGTDPDGTSPYVVNVPEEGIYGFRMVIETTTGLRTPSPEPGDLPEVWIEVDVTKPTARLVDVRLGQGEQAGELTIRWEAADHRLAARPTSLAFAEQADGPWTTIAAGLPADADHYAWRLDSRTPERLFIKLEVRDAAGNVATYVTPQPVTVERMRPQGRIRSVRPIGESARLRTPSQIVPR
jgi:hypothetical protein